MLTGAPRAGRQSQLSRSLCVICFFVFYLHHTAILDHFLFVHMEVIWTWEISTPH